MDANHTTSEVLLVPDYIIIIITTKIIPIPLVLVPLLLNGGDILNMVVEECYDNELEELKAATQCIYDFMLAAAGHDEALDQYEQGDSPRSQSGNIEIISMDPLLSK